MITQNLDVVYLLKDSLNYEELRYSMRSLMFFPCRDVWLYGGKPKWVRGVKHVPFHQSGPTKWHNTRDMMRAVCQNPDVSQNFVLFNDDFFILQPIKDLRRHCCGTLGQRAMQTISKDTHNLSKYGKQLAKCELALLEAGKGNRNFELHIPMIFDKKKLLAVLDKYPDCLMPRSLYCNEYNVRAIEREDVKVEELYTPIPTQSAFVSTNNQSFSCGEVGKKVRGLFPHPCVFEKRWSGLSMTESFGSTGGK